MKTHSQSDSLTRQFLRIVGSPFVSNTKENFGSEQIDFRNISKLYYYASKNRMRLLYLEALNRLNKLDFLKDEYDKLILQYAKTNEVINRASIVLNKSGVPYALFKSVRPYEEVTVDIDVLVFGLISDYKKVIRILYREGYVFLGDGPLSTTFRDSQAGISLDIYYEVGVSHIIYMNKNNLKAAIDTRNVTENQFVLSLSPEADLLAVIAHSVVKEHMYVLSEYFTTLYYLVNMNEDSLKSFLTLVDKCKLRLAVKTHLGITALLHYKAHGLLPDSLARLLKMLDVNSLELSRIEKMGFEIPYKYHPITIVNVLFEKFREKKALRSLATQLFSLLNLSFTSSFIKDVLQHITRKAY